MKKKYTQIDIVFIDVKPYDDVLTSSFEYESSYEGDVYDYSILS